MERLKPLLATQKLWPLFTHLEMPLTPLLAVMELQAITINSNIFIQFSDVLKVL
jgi:DNA polymerase I-like protein with 3'-5' exonuclease and polymerase domains